MNLDQYLPYAILFIAGFVVLAFGPNIWSWIKSISSSGVDFVIDDDEYDIPDLVPIEDVRVRNHAIDAYYALDGCLKSNGRESAREILCKEIWPELVDLECVHE